MPSVAELTRRLDDMIPFAKAAGWDAVGLQIGDRASDVQSIGVCHEVTAAVVASVENDPVDLLVSYHPLVFRPTKSFVAGAAPSGRAFRLARCGVAVAVLHTAFDVARGGAADALADVLGLSEFGGFGSSWGSAAAKIVTFAPDAAIEAIAGAMSDAGGGRIGQYSACSYRMSGFGAFTAGGDANPTTGRAGSRNVEAETRLEMIAPASAVDRVVAALVAHHPYEEPAYDVYDVRANAGFIGRHGAVKATTLGALAAQCGELLSCQPRVAGANDPPIGRVAVVPGSGGSFVAEAAGVADVLVTGDVSHHQARDALDRGLSIIDVGHAPSERPGLDRLYAAVAQLGLPMRSLLELDPDPWS